MAYRPQFVYNDNKNGQKVFSAIEDELLRCDSFAISITFTSSSQKDAGAAVKMAGLKYMLILLLEFWAKVISTQTKFDKKFAEHGKVKLQQMDSGNFNPLG